MREIKFRMPIYDSNEKFLKWHYWGFVEEGGVLVFNGITCDPETAPDISQQYTGLKDKNGKDIYEGDIVRVTCGCGHQENLPVECEEGHNGWFARAVYQHNWDKNQLNLVWTERDNEIIGNIYENPELIKGSGGGIEQD